MTAGIVLLTGAPSGYHLDEAEYLPREQLLPEFQVENISFRRRPINSPEERQSPAWSAIAIRPFQERLQVTPQQKGTDVLEHREFLQSQPLFDKAAAFISFDGAVEESPLKPDDLQDFLNRSVLMHERDSSSEETSFLTEQCVSIVEHAQEMSRISLKKLHNIPSAGYLESIEPQTMTVNLVVGITTAPKLRTVYTTATRRHMTLLELTVGDETRSGFGITIWLGPANGPQSAHADAARQLRRGQVVLFRNLALKPFRGCVYGQSIRRGLTRIGVLDQHCDGKDISAVRGWVADFVPLGQSYYGANTSFATTGAVLLPPDTQ